MNLLDALTIIRQCAVTSDAIATKNSQTALRVIDRKIQGLHRKKAWRDCRGSGEFPPHMKDPNHSLNAGR